MELWKKATEEVGDALRAHYPEDNPIITIVESGATGNFTQTRTLAGMKGLVTNPKGEFIPMLRMYWPKETTPSILNGTWKIPPVMKVG